MRTTGHVNRARSHGSWHQRQPRAQVASPGTGTRRAGGDTADGWFYSGPDHASYGERVSRHSPRAAARFTHGELILADGSGYGMRTLAAGGLALIRIDAIWLATEHLDMRAGADTALARVLKVFGSVRPHHAYLFANRSSTRMKILIYDGFGIWLAARRLNKGRFIWSNGQSELSLPLNPDQLQALVIGLPWKTLTQEHILSVV